MAAHNFESSNIRPEQLRGAFGTVPMIDTMKSVSANAALVPLIRTRIDRSGWWHLVMKRGIENGHLGNRAQEILDNLHAFQFGANMQWCERRYAFYGGAYFVCNYHWVPKA